jgi:hypothetical protein
MPPIPVVFLVNFPYLFLIGSLHCTGQKTDCFSVHAIHFLTFNRSVFMLLLKWSIIGHNKPIKSSNHGLERSAPRKLSFQYWILGMTVKFRSQSLSPVLYAYERSIGYESWTRQRLDFSRVSWGSTLSTLENNNIQDCSGATVRVACWCRLSPILDDSLVGTVFVVSLW